MKRLLAVLAPLALGALAWAQMRERGAEGGGQATNFGVDDGMNNDPRQAGRGHMWDFPTWPVSRELPNDVFTFARIRYNSASGGYGWGRRREKWRTDYPDSDLNLSYRLQQLTSLQVNPNSVVVDIDPEQLRHYPFLYVIEPGDIHLTEEEARALREYMLNGGFIMVDDFWGTREWENFYFAFKQIWPDREFEEVPIEHKIFNMVFPLKVKPQIPHISYSRMVIERGITYEYDKPGSEQVHYRAVYDDKRRMVMFICWNTDTGEGWEQEGTDPWYFKEFSEKYAYPMGINVVMYALTH